MTLNPNGHTMIDAAPLPDLPRLDKVIAHITAHPEEHLQRMWAVDLSVDPVLAATLGRPPCGTAMCVAGHTAHMAGWTMKFDEVIGATSCTRDGQARPIWEVARQELGLSRDEAEILFEGGNTLADITRVRDQIAARYHAALAGDPS